MTYEVNLTQYWRVKNMSKIGTWVMTVQESKAELSRLNPYDKHSNKNNAARQYYVEYSNNRPKSNSMVQLRSS
jgi:hypothetical protein